MNAMKFRGLTGALLMVVGIAAAGLGVCGKAQAGGGDWVNDWFAQESTTAPGHYQSQQRGYYTAGGFDARYRMTNDYLVSLQAPSIKVGCGGIDLVGGSMSYLNAQYLVQKLQRILQAAPAFAFNLAMQEYCKPCEATLQYLEHVSDELNQLQMSDCQAAKGLAHAIVDPSQLSGDIQGLATEANSIENGISDTWNAFQNSVNGNSGKSPNPATNLVSSCPSDFVNIFTNGSIVENMAGYLGVNQYAPLMRGMLGDIIVSYNSTTNTYGFQDVSPCPGNDAITGNDFLNGNVQTRTVSGSSLGSCATSSFTSVISVVDNNMQAVAAGMTGGAGLTSQQIAFVNQAPLPMFSVLRDAVMEGRQNDVIALLDETLAVGYTYRILSDFYLMNQQVVNKANELNIQTAANPGTGPNNCDVKFLQPAVQKLKDMKENALRYRGLAEAAFNQSSQETAANLQMAKALYEERIHVLNQHANAMDRGGKQ